MLLYQIQAILNLKFTVSNTSNKQKASKWWVEGWWRETIDYKSNRSEILCWGLLYQIQAILSHCCIKYKQLAKGQKDNGRRETWQTINKQKNKSCLFVNLFGCFHDLEHDIVQHFCWLAGLLFLALGLKVGKCLKTWYRTSFSWHLCLEILGIVAHSICQYCHNFFFWENWSSSDEITGMVSKNSIAYEELASEIFLWTTISGTHTYRWYLYRRQAMYNFLWLGICSNLVDREFWNECDNSGEQSF